jgi:hypothetical protein
VKSSVRLSCIITVVALAGAAATAPSVAQAAVRGPKVIYVPCRTDALAAAISTADSHGGGILILSGQCTYDITTPATVASGLPAISADISMTGGEHTVIRRGPAAATAFRILDVAAGGTLSLTGISIRNGHTSGLGGGIQNAGTVSLTAVSLSGNTAGNGGALANLAGATANVSGVVITDNKATGVGGGGIINSGMLKLSGSTVTGNSAPINGGGLNTQQRGTSRIVRSTFARNISGGLGGGISNLGTMSLSRSTVRLNRGSSGGGIATGNSHVTLHDSVISSNNPDNCSPLNTIPGCRD